MCLIFRNNLFAHLNSRLRIATPAGITTNAGPGVNNNMTPTNMTADPAIRMTIFRTGFQAYSIVSLIFMGEGNLQLFRFVFRDENGGNNADCENAADNHQRYMRRDGIVVR